MISDRALIRAGGVAAPLAAGSAIGIAIGAPLPATAPWFLPWVIAYATGVIAVRRLPQSLGAQRLLLFGTVGTIWNAGSLLLCVAVANLEHGAWLTVPNTLLVGLDFAMPATLLAVLAHYPDGRYERPYERHVVRGVAWVVVVVPLLLLVVRDTLEPAMTVTWLVEYTGEVDVASPLHVGALDFLAAPVSGMHEGVLPLFTVLGLVLMGVRRRRATAEQRRGMLWPFAAVLAIAVTDLADVLVALQAFPHFVGDFLELGVLLAIPVSIAIGILRPDLFDLPRAMRRSAVYVVLWVAIALAYVGLAAALGIAAGSDRIQIAVLVTIAATLAFQPLWRRVRRGAEQRLYGERPAPEELLRRFGAALEHTLDLDELAPNLAEAMRGGLGVKWVRLTLEDRVVTAGDGEGDAVASVPLVHAGAQVGSIDCGPRLHGRFGGSDRELLETLGHQAALALHNARLAAEARDRLEQIHLQAAELAASRTRIVEAEEAARRRIERDVHDGVQQELVALIARIALAQNQLSRDPSLVTRTLADLQLEARQALDDLRELVGGIHPSVLSDYGIVGAIEARASRLPLGVTIECDRELRATRFSETVEGAVYFLVSEGFANALKHSGAERVVVRLDQEDGELVVAVSDHGRGFDVATAEGSGLSGLADRIDALGGQFGVESRPGGGTCLTARLPTGERARV